MTGFSVKSVFLLVVTAVVVLGLAFAIYSLLPAEQITQSEYNYRFYYGSTIHLNKKITIGEESHVERIDLEGILSGFDLTLVSAVPPKLAESKDGFSVETNGQINYSETGTVLFTNRKNSPDSISLRISFEKRAENSAVVNIILPRGFVELLDSEQRIELVTSIESLGALDLNADEAFEVENTLNKDFSKGFTMAELREKKTMPENIAYFDDAESERGAVAQSLEYVISGITSTVQGILKKRSGEKDREVFSDSTLKMSISPQPVVYPFTGNVDVIVSSKNRYSGARLVLSSSVGDYYLLWDDITIGENTPEEPWQLIFEWDGKDISGMEIPMEENTVYSLNLEHGVEVIKRVLFVPEIYELPLESKREALMSFYPWPSAIIIELDSETQEGFDAVEIVKPEKVYILGSIELQEIPKPQVVSIEGFVRDEDNPDIFKSAGITLTFEWIDEEEPYALEITAKRNFAEPGSFMCPKYSEIIFSYGIDAGGGKFKTYLKISGEFKEEMNLEARSNMYDCIITNDLVANEAKLFFDMVNLEDYGLKCSPHLVQQNRCILRPDAARILQDAQEILMDEYGEELNFEIKSAWRSVGLQAQIFWGKVNSLMATEGLSRQAAIAKARKTIAYPSDAAPHNSGGAVDVCITGTPAGQNICWSLGKNATSFMKKKDAKMLYDVMTNAGFIRYSNAGETKGEWWHFEYGTEKWMVAQINNLGHCGTLNSEEHACT